MSKLVFSYFSEPYGIIARKEDDYLNSFGFGGASAVPAGSFLPSMCLNKPINSLQLPLLPERPEAAWREQSVDELLEASVKAVKEAPNRSESTARMSTSLVQHRSKEAAPQWDGQVAFFQEYEEQSLQWEQSLAYHKRAQQYYKTTFSNRGASDYKSDYKSQSSPGVKCLRCGQADRTGECLDKHPTAKMNANQGHVAEEAPFVCFSDADGTDAAAMVAAMGAKSTRDAVKAGYAVIDGGATRALGSIEAIQKVMDINEEKHGTSRLASVNNKPVFCLGIAIRMPVSQMSQQPILKLQQGIVLVSFRVHALDKGQGPILISIQALRKVKAVIDFDADLMGVLWTPPRSSHWSDLLPDINFYLSLKICTKMPSEACLALVVFARDNSSLILCLREKGRWFFRTQRKSTVTVFAAAAAATAQDPTSSVPSSDGRQDASQRVDRGNQGVRREPSERVDNAGASEQSLPTPGGTWTGPRQTDSDQFLNMGDQIKLNVVSKKETNLPDFCLKLPLTMSKTSPQLQLLAMSTPHAPDPVAFGNEEVKLDVNYCVWLQNTWEEGSKCPQLQRCEWPEQVTHPACERPSAAVELQMIKVDASKPEQGAEREHLLEHLSEDDQKRAPWTFQRLTEGLGYFVGALKLRAEQPDGSFHLSQAQYVEKIPEVYVSVGRKKEPKAETTEKEKSALRATLSALSWHAQPVAPHISAEAAVSGEDLMYHARLFFCSGLRSLESSSSGSEAGSWSEPSEALPPRAERRNSEPVVFNQGLDHWKPSMAMNPVRHAQGILEQVAGRSPQGEPVPEIDMPGCFMAAPPGDWTSAPLPVQRTLVTLGMWSILTRTSRGDRASVDPPRCDEVSGRAVRDRKEAGRISMLRMSSNPSLTMLKLANFQSKI
eukprot:s126_g39.t1